MKLILCSGGMKMEGWTTLDVNPDHHPDILAAVPPIPPGPWEEIMLIHGIEHFSNWEGEELLKQCYQELVPGGKLVLEQPNLEVCCKVVLGQLEIPSQQFPDQYGLAGIYGARFYHNDLMMHRWGYTPETLKESLVKAGFREDQVVKAGAVHYHSNFRDFRMEATK